MLHLTVTYTTATEEGARREQTATFTRPYRLTLRGAEQMLRRQFHNPTIVVTRIDTLLWSEKDGR